MSVSSHLVFSSPNRVQNTCYLSMSTTGMGFGDLIPDGQTNTFVTDKGTVSDWAVSSDAPEWIVAQARRADPNGVLQRDNDFSPDDGQINEMKLTDGSTGLVSDWAISGDGPNWMTDNVSKYDVNAVIHRPPKVQGVKGKFSFQYTICYNNCLYMVGCVEKLTSSFSFVKSLVH